MSKMATECGRHGGRAPLRPSREGFSVTSRVVLPEILTIPSIAGLCLFSFGYVGGLALANIGLGILLLVFLAALRANWRILARDTFIRYSLLWIIVAIGLAAHGAALFPRVAASQYSSLTEIWSFGFIPLVALATRGNPRLVATTLLLALAGVLFRLVKDVYLGVGPPDHYDNRALGVGRNLAVLMIDTGAAGCLTLLMALIVGDVCHGWLRTVAIPVCFAALAALLWAWIAAASRTSLVALPVVFSILMVRRLLLGRFSAQARIGLMFLLLVLAVLFHLNFETFLAEVLSDQSTWRLIAEGHIVELPETATGLRFHMWHLAYGYWVQQPFIGFGPSVAHLLRTDPAPPFLGAFNQFHSGYVELLLRAGLVGVAFYCGAAVLIWRVAVRARSRGDMPVTVFEILLSGFFLMIVLNLTNSVMFFQQGWQFLVMFGGIAYGYHWLDIGQDESRRVS